MDYMITVRFIPQQIIRIIRTDTNGAVPTELFVHEIQKQLG